MIREGLKDRGNRVILPLVLAAALLLPLELVEAKEGGAEPPPAGEMWAQHCAQQRPSLIIIRSQRHFQGLLGKDYNQAKAPDFQKEAVVIVYLGLKMTGGYGVEFQEPYVEKGKVIVPFRERVPGPGMIVTQALTTPCRLKVIEAKPDQEVIAKNLLAVADVTYQPIRMRKDSFHCEIPRGWYREVYERILEKDTGGIMLMAPPEIEGEGVKIFLTYYPHADEELANNPAAYVEKYLNAEISQYYIKEKFQALSQPPANGPPGRWYGRESSITSRDGFNRKITVKEQLEVVPGPKGFYVLHYWAPVAIFEKYAPVFQRVVKSFQPVICSLLK